MRYRDGPLVLKGVSLYKVVIGLGLLVALVVASHSLAAALFRIVELDGGSISIDGMDTRKLGV